MMVPALVEQLHESHAPFHQTSCQQAVIREAGFARLRAILLVNVFGFVGNIHQLGHGRLHAIRHLVLIDACRDFRISYIGQLYFVEMIDAVDDPLAVFARHPFRIRQKQDGVSRGTKFDALVNAGQKAAAPQAVSGSRDVAGNQNDKAGQVTVCGTQAIVDPRTQGGTSEA